MRKRAIEKIHKELKEKKTEILNRLMKDREQYYENLKGDGGDLADEASESIEREIIYDLSIAEKNEVEEIDEAIKRIEDGTYGTCDTCGGKIPLGRLEAKPYARLCMECREEEERKKKHPPVQMEDE